MVPVSVAITFTDSLSGMDKLALTAAACSDCDDPSDDIEGFSLGMSYNHGALRAERSGAKGGRLYTLEYTGPDLAGNVTSCMMGVSVPHDQGKKRARRS